MMRVARRLAAVLMMIGLAGSLGGRVARAQGQGPQPFTLQPGGRATLTFEAYCLDFGRAFPDTVQVPNALAPDPIRGALAYGVNNNLTDTKEEALSLQHAIWRLSNVQGAPQGDALTQQIIDAAQPASPAPSDATSVIDAANANQVSITVDSWQPLGEQVQIGNLTAYYRGSGQLTVENTSQQPVTLYMPIGTVLPSPNEAVQNMGAFPTGVEVQNQATPTPQPTETPMPTATPQPTGTPMPTATPQPTETPMPTATPPSMEASTPAGSEQPVLPETGSSAAGLGWLPVAAALGILAAGWLIRPRRRRG